MSRNRALIWCLVSVIAIGLMTTGCKTGPGEEELKLEQLKQLFASIQTDQDALQQLRADIEAKRATAAELEAIPEATRTPEQAQQLTDLKSTIETDAAAVTAAYDALQERLAEFLTSALNEFPSDPVTVQGLDMYAQEAIANADETIEKAGDYKKAIDLLDTAAGYYEALQLPVFPALLEHRSAFEEARFITQERFDVVTNGMTEAEVKLAAGIPYYRNIQEDTEKGVTSWLYPKKDGGAAAIYFRKATGKVYGKNFEAVKTRVAAQD